MLPCWFVTIRISFHAFIGNGSGFSGYLKRYDEMQLNHFKRLLVLRHFLFDNIPLYRWLF